MVIEAAVNEFNEAYPDEQSCIDAVESLRWENGVSCVKCGGGSIIRMMSRRMPLFECRSCRDQFSLTSGTIMHKSRTPLRKWLLAIYLVACHKDGVNATKLSQIIEVTYKTAWKMLHCIRLSISWMDQQRTLSGLVEAKLEIFGRQTILTENRLMKERSIIIAHNKETAGPGYYRLAFIPRHKHARALLNVHEQEAFMAKHCEKDATIVQMNPRFQQLRKLQYYKVIDSDGNEKWTCESQSLDPMYPLSRMTDNILQWMNDTYHGIGIKYAQHYLDEGCFRLNYGAFGSAAAFNRLLLCVLNSRHVDQLSAHISLSSQDQSLHSVC